MWSQVQEPKELQLLQLLQIARSREKKEFGLGEDQQLHLCFMMTNEAHKNLISWLQHACLRF